MNRVLRAERLVQRVGHERHERRDNASRRLERQMENLVARDLRVRCLAAQACAESDLIWLESPSNPLLAVAELGAVCSAPRKRGAILGVDNAFATPLNQRPLALGADVAVESVTKFIGGHSDFLGGVVTVRDSALLAAFRQARELAGATPGALETFLAVRGARTLAVRLERAQWNAMVLAGRLADHPEVLITRYPGLASHPTHEAARRQMKGCGTIISFDIRGGAEAADAVCAGCG